MKEAALASPPPAPQREEPSRLRRCSAHALRKHFLSHTDPDSASLQLQRPGVSTAGAAMCKQASAMQPAAPRSVARGCLSLIIFQH